MEYSNCSNCSNSSDGSEQLRIAYYSANAIGVVGASVLLIAMLCIKAFKTVLQRLFIVVVVVTLVHDTCRLASIFYRKDHSQDQACILLALVLQWCHWCLYLSLSVVVACLLTMVCMYSQQNSMIVHKVRSSKRLRILIEVGVNTGMLLAPWTLIWAPLIRDQYGFDGIVCAIVPSNSSTDTFTAPDSLVHIFYDYAPRAIFAAISGISAAGMVVVYCIMPVEMKEARKVIKKLTISMLILFVYFTCNSLQGSLKMEICQV